MASELTPFERDIIRLRLGLEDGKTRSIREVASVYGGAVNMSGMFQKLHFVRYLLFCQELSSFFIFKISYFSIH